MSADVGIQNPSPRHLVATLFGIWIEIILLNFVLMAVRMGSEM